MPAEPIDLDETVLIGEHPDYPYLDVVVVGSRGRDEDWATACQLADTALRAGGRRFRTDPGAVVVDARHDVVRPARTLRRIRRPGGGS
jgi:hypothetical protein